MELTQEQKDIINTVHNDEPIIKINAYAGTGKTTTLVEVVKEIRNTNPSCNILYLVFNKLMAKEASNKFAGLNVQCYTAHAFALKRICLAGTNVKVLSGSDFTNEYFKLKNKKDDYKYVAYKKVKLLMDSFTSIRAEMDDFLEDVAELGLEGASFKDNDLKFFREFYQTLIDKHWYTHGMYLKEYALHYNDIIRGYDYILLDEAQDLNPFMMDIIKRVERKKLYVVGDNYQQIYAWNNAINSMQEYEGTTYPLSKSFRFNDEIREIADLILRTQKSYRESPVKITNTHNDTYYDKSKVTYLFRTNAAMLETAIRIVISSKEKIKMHFMDMISGSETNGFDETFTEMLEFTKLMLDECYGNNSIAYLEFNSKFPIKSKTKNKTLQNYIKISKDEFYSSLYEYLLNNESILSLEYMRYWSIFKMLGKNITKVLDRVRKAELATEYTKEYTLCTAHRAKGSEWEYVVVSPDKWDIENTDENNLLYVACTRAMRKLDYSGILNIIDYLKDEYGDIVCESDYEIALDVN